MIHYRVFVLGPIHAGWQSILSNHGIPFKFGETLPSCSEFPILVITDRAPSVEKKDINAYLGASGSMICSAACATRIMDIPSKSVKLTFVLPDDIYQSIGLVDIERSARVTAETNCLSGGGGELFCSLREMEGGMVAILPFDAGDLISAHDSAERSFYVNSAKLPHERVAVPWKRGICRIVSRTIEALLHRHDLPSARLWHHESAGSVPFALRIDTDGAADSHVIKLKELLDARKLSATWFVDVRSQQPWLSTFKAMEGHEIGVHCYEHVNHSEPTGLKRDIEMARSLFAAAGISNPAGYAAPYGTWSEEAGVVIESAGFQYSSEFSYDYDGLPSRPILRGRHSECLQVPIHPISIGSLRRQGINGTGMISYFLNLFDENIARREPIVLLHHPKDGHPEVLENLIDAAKERGMTFMTMGAMAAWWKKREGLTMSIQFDEAGFSWTHDGDPAGFLVQLTRKDGTEAFLRAGKHTIEEIEWQRAPVIPKLPADIRRIREFNPWIHVNRAEDTIANVIKKM